MANNTGAKWQPVGEQFAVACRVCAKEGTLDCCDCMCEKTPSFEFDPRKYIKLCQEITGGRLEGAKHPTARPNYEELYKKLSVDYAELKNDHESMETEFVRMRAQLDIVYLIFGK